jgi:hypothetical protein
MCPTQNRIESSKNLSQSPAQPSPVPFVPQPESVPGIPAAEITNLVANTRVEDSVLLRALPKTLGENDTTYGLCYLITTGTAFTHTTDLWLSLQTVNGK